MIKAVKNSFFVVLLIAADQLAKFWAKTYLKGNADIPIIKNVFSLHYLENRGAAFGIFQNRQIFFILTTTGILIFIAYALYKLPKEAKYRPLEFIALVTLSGAIGNLIDRLTHRYVIDFLYFELIDFPVFNIADCYVSCSAFLLVLLVLFYYKEEDFSFLSRKEA